jgi:AraC-like DNA-binding protein
VRQNLDFSFITNILTSALVERIGEAEPETKILTIADLASLLNRFERTLIRQLKANNTTFRQIKDEMLREYASDLLIKGTPSIFDIAVKLGYENPCNFTRACK